MDGCKYVSMCVCMYSCKQVGLTMSNKFSINSTILFRLNYNYFHLRLLFGCSSSHCCCNYFSNQPHPFIAILQPRPYKSHLQICHMATRYNSYFPSYDELMYQKQSILTEDDVLHFRRVSDNDLLLFVII